MKKIIMILILVIWLTSCGMTQEEILKEYKKCEAIWQQWRYEEWFWWSVWCDNKETNEDKIMRCVREYTNWLDEKYNNPDTVTNLREDNYSNVVKTCNEIFWDINWINLWQQ